MDAGFQQQRKAEGDERKSPPLNLKDRTSDFALAVIRLYGGLPKSAVEQVVGRPLLRAGTSVGAHYREGHRPRSTAESISKLEGAVQELEDTRYWLKLPEVVADPASLPLPSLIAETDELIAMVVASVKTEKGRQPS